MIRTFQPATKFAIDSVYSGVTSDALGAAEEDIIAYRKRMMKEFGVPGLSDVSALSGEQMVGFLATVPATRLLAANLVFTGLKVRATGGFAQKDVENNVARMAETANLLGLSRRGALMWAKSNIESAIAKSKNAQLPKLRTALIEVLSETPATDEGVAAELPPAAGTLNSKLLAGKWNDGKYTYTIDAAGTVKVGGKTFSKSDAPYATVAANLNKDFSSGKLKSGSAPVRSYSPPAELPAAPPEDTSAPGLQNEPSLTEAWWFWPTVGISTVAVGAGVYWAFFRKTEQ